MALAADTPRAYEAEPAPRKNDLPAQVDVIYAGSALTYDSNGDVGPLATGETFAGFARKKVDNSGGSAGDVDVPVIQVGAVRLDVTSVSGDGDLGSTVYASDDDTFTLASTGNLRIGKVIRHVSGTTCIVAFEASQIDSPLG